MHFCIDVEYFLNKILKAVFLKYIFIVRCGIVDCAVFSVLLLLVSPLSWYRNFWLFTCAADYLHMSIFAIVTKKI